MEGDGSAAAAGLASLAPLGSLASLISFVAFEDFLSLLPSAEGGDDLTSFAIVAGASFALLPVVAAAGEAGSVEAAA